MSKRSTGIVSAAFAVCWVAALMVITAYKPFHNLLLYILAALYIFLFLRFYFLPRMLPNVTRVTKWLFPIAFAVSFACILLFNIKFSEAFYYQNTEISVTSTGAADVLISDIKLDGRGMDLAKLTNDNGWELYGVNLVSPADSQPARVSFSSGHADTAVISMAVNPWSGVVEISGNDDTIEIDLYDEDPDLGLREYDISELLNDDIPFAPVRRLAFYGLQLMLLYPLALCLVYYFLKRKEEKQA
jgi:hypothetical protein